MAKSHLSGTDVYSNCDCAICCVFCFNNPYGGLERKQLEKLYDDIIKIGEHDMNKRSNQIILKNCLQVFFFVDEDRYSDETFALKEARQKAVSYKNYFKYIK